MALMDSLQISLIGFAVVFGVLIVLSFFIKFQSMLIGYITAPRFTGSLKADYVTAVAESAITADGDEGWSAGELKLLGVDERTAAMIMAIVSHESKIPLSELQFKMIKAIN